MTFLKVNDLYYRKYCRTFFKNSRGSCGKTKGFETFCVGRTFCCSFEKWPTSTTTDEFHFEKVTNIEELSIPNGFYCILINEKSRISQRRLLC